LKNRRLESEKVDSWKARRLGGTDAERWGGTEAGRMR